jgi:hypothetical protein
LFKYPGQSDVRAVAFFPSNEWLASAGSDGDVPTRTVAGELVKSINRLRTRRQRAPRQEDEP